MATIVQRRNVKDLEVLQKETLVPLSDAKRQVYTPRIQEAEQRKKKGAVS